MWNARLDEAQAEIKITGRNINYLRYADDTTIMAESKEELKSLLMKVKEESEKVGLKLNTQWQPTPVLLPGKVYGQRSLAGYSPWGHKEVTQLSSWAQTKATLIQMELISKSTVMCTKIVSPNQVLFVGSGGYNLGIPLEPLLNLLQSGKKEQNQKLNIQKTKIMASGPITSWQINGETKETVRDFNFLGSKITADDDCSHEIKRRLLLGRKFMTHLDSILKSRDITLPTKVHLIKAMVFPVVMYGCESWTVKKVECWRIDAFELWCWRRLLRVSWTARRAN